MSETADDTRACPRCAETIKAAAMVCRFCGAQLTEARWIPPDEGPPTSAGSGGCIAALGWFLLLGVAAFGFLIWYGGSRSDDVHKAVRPIAETAYACESSGGQIPALNRAVIERLPDPASFRVASTKATAGGNSSYLDAVLMFVANDKAGRRKEGTAKARISGPSCAVSGFEWVCWQPGFAPKEGQLFCAADGTPEPT